MAIKHDDQGFIVGRPLGESETLDLLSAIENEIKGLRGDLALHGNATSAMASPTGGANEAGAPSMGGRSLTPQADAATGPQVVAVSNDTEASKAQPASVNNDNSVTNITNEGDSSSYVAQPAPGRNVAPSSPAVMTPAATVGGEPQAVATPSRASDPASAGAKRGANGRFLPKVATPESAAAGDSGPDQGGEDDSTAGSLSLRSSLGDIGEKIAGAISAVPLGGETDPSVQALNEVAQPLKRGFGMVFGGDKDKSTDRWYRRFWRDMRDRKKIEKKHNKRQIDLLEDIEDQSGEGKKGGFFGIILGFLGLLLKALLPLKLLSALSKIPGAGWLKPKGDGKKPRAAGSGRDRRANSRTREANGQGRSRQSSARAGQSGSTASRAGSSAGRAGGAVGRGLRRVPLLGVMLTLMSVASGVRASESDETATRRQKDGRTGGAIGGGAGTLAGAMAGGSIGGTAGAAIGTMIFPGVGTAIGGAIGSLAGAIGGAIIGDSAGEIIGEQVGSWVSDIRESDIGGAIISTWNVTSNFMGHLWGQATDAFSSKWDTVTTAVSGAWSTTAEAMSSAWEVTTAKFADVSGAIVEKWDEALGLMQKGWSKVTDLASKWWGSVSDAADKANEWIKDTTGVDIKSTAINVRNNVTETYESTRSAVKGAVDQAGGWIARQARKMAKATGVTGAVNAVKRSASYATNKEALRQGMADAGITDPKEMASFMGQMDHESGGLTSLNESFNYSSADRVMAVSKTARDKGGGAVSQAMSQGPEAVAELMYGGRMGNVNEGDGYAFRGRGFTQLTGRDNYTAASESLGIDLVNNPDLASDPDTAAKIATWYWQSRSGLSEAGKAGDVEGATRKINGGTNGLADRKAKTAMYEAEIAAGGFSSPKPVEAEIAAKEDVSSIASVAAESAGTASATGEKAAALTPEAMAPVTDPGQRAAIIAEHAEARAWADEPEVMATTGGHKSTVRESMNFSGDMMMDSAPVSPANSQVVAMQAAMAPMATNLAPASHPITPKMIAPIVPTPTAVSAAPEVRAPMGAASKDKQVAPGRPDVSRDLADRKIAHVVTGAYSQS